MYSYNKRFLKYVHFCGSDPLGGVECDQRGSSLFWS